MNAAAANVPQPPNIIYSSPQSASFAASWNPDELQGLRSAARAEADSQTHSTRKQNNATLKAGRLTICSNSSPYPLSIPVKPKGDKAPDEDGHKQKRANGYRLRRLNRSMIDDIHDTLAHCGLGIIDNPDGSKGTGKFACHHETGAVIQSGIMTCHSPVACPCCAPKIAARRALALTPQVESRVAEGCSVSLATLTLRHKRGDSLADMIRALSKAWSRVASGKFFNNLRKRGYVGFVRGYDFTWSEKHGWHPHIHTTLILGPEQNEEELCEAIIERWQSALAKEGLRTSRSAQHYDRADNPAAAAKYAVSPAAVYEALAMSMKRARGKGAGLTPFEILEKAAADKEAGIRGSRWVALWREYVKATKGRRQVVTSQDLTLDLPEEPEPEGMDTVLRVGGHVLREMDERTMVPEVLNVIEDNIGDPHGMRAALHVIMSSVRSCDWVIPDWDDGSPRRFRTEMDDIDRMAMKIPDSAERLTAAEIQNRQQSRRERVYTDC